MPVIHTKDFNQQATYWAPEANDGFGGKVFASPVLITCRWQDKTDLVRNTDGREVVSSAVAYVDRDLNTEGYLALGDFTGESQPTAGTQIISKSSSPDLSNREVLLKVWL